MSTFRGIIHFGDNVIGITKILNKFGNIDKIVLNNDNLITYHLFYFLISSI